MEQETKNPKQILYTLYETRYDKYSLTLDEKFADALKQDKLLYDNINNEEELKFWKEFNFEKLVIIIKYLNHHLLREDALNQLNISDSLFDNLFYDISDYIRDQAYELDYSITYDSDITDENFEFVE